MEPGSELTPEMRYEIERLLRAGGDGLSHGAVFCLRAQGLRTDEIAARRGVSVPETKRWLASLDHLLSGTIPTGATAAMTNSYAYRYVLYCAPSERLLSYAKARLRDLRAINPNVSMEPMPPRSHQHAKGQARPDREPTREKVCSDCGLMHAGECQ